MRVAVPPSQLDLFATGPVPEPVGPARPDPELAGLASHLPASLRLGTSSWSFPGWAGLVYDRAASEATLARAGLGPYARHPLLRAVGIDRTYYAPIPAEAFARYAADVPEDFRFLVKASQECTSPTLATPTGGHAPNPRFLDPAWARDEVVGPAATGLGGKLGVLLFQFPPVTFGAGRSPGAVLDRLERFLGALPRGVPLAVELRSPGLLGARYAEILASTGTAHAYNVHPSMPPVEEQASALPVERQPLLLVRWMLGHGRGYEEARELYRPFDRLAAPDPDARAAVARLCAAGAWRGRPVLVIVNNKAEGSSPLSVVALARALLPLLARRPGG
jgi:uncharacterized protein YecE (DUF72 family)